MSLIFSLGELIHCSKIDHLQEPLRFKKNGNLLLGPQFSEFNTGVGILGIQFQ